MRYVVVSGIALALLSGAAGAKPVIYAMNNLGNAGPGANENTLVMFNATNPAGFTTIGATGLAGSGFTGLDFAGFGGGLYGYVGFGTAGTIGLYKINKQTGAATVKGQLSGVALQDLSWNPVTGKMMGIDGANLFEVSLTGGNKGQVTQVGTFTGFTVTPLNVGLAVDSTGHYYVHDLAADRIYKSTAPGATTLSSLYVLPNNTNFSQGMTIDWSNDNKGYHAAIGNTPSFFSKLYSFNSDGSAYTLLGNFTPDGVFPTFEGGDLAIEPVPAPGAVALLGFGALAAARRRRS